MGQLDKVSYHGQRVSLSTLEMLKQDNQRYGRPERTALIEKRTNRTKKPKSFQAAQQGRKAEKKIPIFRHKIFSSGLSYRGIPFIQKKAFGREVREGGFCFEKVLFDFGDAVASGPAALCLQYQRN